MQTIAPKLSVVVVSYNMRREAVRTLYSLTTNFQKDIEEYDYEVIVVVNPLSPTQSCTVTGGNSGNNDGTGTMVGADVTDIVVSWFVRIDGFEQKQ